MARDKYDVQGGAPPAADTSFRSCLLAILIFVFLCLLLVALAIGLQASRASDTRANHAPNKEIEVVHQSDRLGAGATDEEIETLTSTSTSTPSSGVETHIASTTAVTSKVGTTSAHRSVTVFPASTTVRLVSNATSAVTEGITLAHGVETMPPATTVDEAVPNTTAKTTADTTSINGGTMTHPTTTAVSNTAATTTTTTTTTTASTPSTTLALDSEAVHPFIVAMETESNTTSTTPSATLQEDIGTAHHLTDAVESGTTKAVVTSPTSLAQGNETVHPLTVAADAEPDTSSVTSGATLAQDSETVRSSIAPVEAETNKSSTTTVSSTLMDSNRTEQHVTTTANSAANTMIEGATGEHISSTTTAAETTADMTTATTPVATVAHYTVSGASNSTLEATVNTTASVSVAPASGDVSMGDDVVTNRANESAHSGVSSTEASRLVTSSVLPDVSLAADATTTSGLLDGSFVQLSHLQSTSFEGMSSRDSENVTTAADGNTSASPEVIPLATTRTNFAYENMTNSVTDLIYGTAISSPSQPPNVTLESILTTSATLIPETETVDSSTAMSTKDQKFLQQRVYVDSNDNTSSTTSHSDTSDTDGSLATNIVSSLDYLASVTQPVSMSTTGASEANTALSEIYESGSNGTATTSDDLSNGSTASISASEEAQPLSNCSVFLPLAANTSQGRTVCRTDACYRHAQHMASMMNHTEATRPCRKFYLAACGGLQSNELLSQPNPLAEAYSRIQDEMANEKPLPLAIEKLRKFQKSCIEYATNAPDVPSRLSEVKKVLNKIGTFSFDSSEWLDYRAKFTDLFYMLLKYNSSPLFDILLDVEGKDNATFVFKLVPPLSGSSLFSGDRVGNFCKRNTTKHENEKEIKTIDVTLKSDEYWKCKESVDTITTAAEMVDRLGYQEGAEEDIKEKFKDILKTSLKELNDYIKDSPKAAVLREEQLTKTYKISTIDNMDSQFPLMYWKTLFSKLVGNYPGTIEGNVVQIYSPTYFEIIISELASRSQKETDFAKDLNNALLASTAQRLFDDFVPLHNSCNRVAYCQHVAYDLMSQAASAAYIRSFSADHLKEMRNRADETFLRLKSTLHSELKDAKWLDDESKTELIDHLQSVQLAPYEWGSFLLNDTYLNDYYKEFNVNSTNYIQNAADLVVLNKKHAYSLYLKNPLDPKYIWSHFKYPYHTDGNVIYGLNTIVLPLGVLAKHSNDATLPKYINMAGEGFVIAHELAHMFDFVGMKQDFHQKALKLSSHSSSIFSDLEVCLQSKYDYATSHQTEDGAYLDFRGTGSLSANERFADFTGMLLAYKTYSKMRENTEELLPLLTDWTPEQLFFLQAAQGLCSKEKLIHHITNVFEDEHMPPAIRVDNIVSNSEEFWEVFTCPESVTCGVFPRLQDSEELIPPN